MGPKDFKTIDELIAKLEQRGVATDDQTRAAILSESYYAVVNGYKEPFLDRSRMASTHDDVYLPGTHFSEIYSLFLFDRELRSLAFGYLIKAEALMKTTVVYAFCKKHQGHTAYLDRSNYVGPADMLMPKGSRANRYRKHREDLDDLIAVLQGKASGKTSYKDFIQHYIDRYGFVPLWVLSNDLTFGNISHFYQLQTRDVQNEACKQIVEYRRANGDKVNGLAPLKLLHAFNVLYSFRNLCAHDERLYNAKVGKSKDITFKEMLRVLGMVLPESDCNRLKRAVVDLVDKYKRCFKTIAASTIYEAMGGVDEQGWRRSGQ